MMYSKGNKKLCNNSSTKTTFQKGVQVLYNYCITS